MFNHVLKNNPLISVPPKKVTSALGQTLRKCSVCSANGAKIDNSCDNCRVINTALNRYAEANVPIKYWYLDMKSFKGDPILSKTYNSICEDLSNVYNTGKSVCFAGSYGIGKTYTVTNILKRAVEKGFSALYVTLGDIVAQIISGPDKFSTRKLLMTVDFLVIDEFDPRYMPTDAASDLYGRTLEDVLRRRAENNMPLFMCTNSPNVVDSFQGSIKRSITSLMHHVQIVTALGGDFRGRNE